MTDPAATDPPSAPAESKLRSLRSRLIRTAARNTWLGLVAGAALVVTRTVDFSPPAQVRMQAADAGAVVGEAPAQDFARSFQNPQSVQLRGTLRLYPDASVDLTQPDPERAEAGRLLSQPVVTTIYGMNATINQTVRLEGGDLEIDITINATPRLAHQIRPGKADPPIVVEHELTVRSRRSSWLNNDLVERVHLDTAQFLSGLEERGHRMIFAVDEHLFTLELELHRPDSPLEETLAGVK